MTKINFPIALLSLTLSIVAWFFVYGQNLEDESSVPVGLKNNSLANLAPGRWSIGSIGKASVKVRAPQIELPQIKKSLMAGNGISVDMSAGAEGPHQYPLVFPPELTKFIITPSPSVQVDLEPLVTKKVKVQIETKGELQDHELSIQGVSYGLKSVLVTGPKSRIDAVTEVDGFLDLAKINADKPEPQSVILSAVSSKGEILSDIPVSPPTVQAQAMLVAAPSQRRVLVSPNTKNPPSGAYKITVEPPFVTLTGGFSVVSGISTLWTESIDLSGVTASTTIRSKVLYPVGTKGNVRYVNVHVTVPKTLQSVTPTEKSSRSSKPSATFPSEVPPIDSKPGGTTH